MPFRSISLEKLSDSLSTQVVEESGNFLRNIDRVIGRLQKKAMESEVKSQSCEIMNFV